MNYKKCSKCNKFKILFEFSKGKNKNSLRSCCKECEKKYFRQWYLKNKKRKNQQSKNWYTKNKEKANRYSREYYRKHYGVSDKEWKRRKEISLQNRKARKRKYVRCPQEFISMADSQGKVKRSRLAFAQHLNRPLKRNEVIHHKDKNTLNDNLSNLILFKNKREHRLHHIFNSKYLTKE